MCCDQQSGFQEFNLHKNSKSAERCVYKDIHYNGSYKSGKLATTCKSIIRELGREVSYGMSELYNNIQLLKIVM